MFIYLETELFTEKSNFRTLDKIIHVFEEGKHIWIIETDEDCESILDSAWMESQSEEIQGIIFDFVERAFKELINIPINDKKNRKTLRISQNDGDDSISLEFATLYLAEPLYILVENEFSDSAFLKSLFRCFKNRGKKLRKALENNWLKFYNGGGKTMLNRIIIDRLERTPLPQRLFVFADSDSKSPSDLPRETQELLQLCEDNQIPIHILQKREIENYLTRKVLSNVPNDLLNVTENLFSLDPVQQDFYDLKDGLNRCDEGLFKTITNDQRKNLKYGYRSKEYNPEKELYLLFGHEDINRNDLMKKCEHQTNPEELNDILDNLRSIL